MTRTAAPLPGLAGLSQNFFNALGVLDGVGSRWRSVHLKSWWVMLSRPAPISGTPAGPVPFSLITVHNPYTFCWILPVFLIPALQPVLISRESLFFFLSVEDKCRIWKHARYILIFVLQKRQQSLSSMFHIVRVQFLHEQIGAPVLKTQAKSKKIINLSLSLTIVCRETLSSILFTSDYTPPCTSRRADYVILLHSSDWLFAILLRGVECRGNLTDNRWSRPHCLRATLDPCQLAVGV